MKPLVDVIVPVYRDLEVTRRALTSVLAARNTTPFELIVIDDATPEPALASYLDELARTGAITLVRQPDNRGFVATANRGMRLHLDRDVVLLNSDTEVYGDWLDRLRAAALTAPLPSEATTVGTATPLTNSGWICSYPGFPVAGPLPEGSRAADLDAICRVVNAGVRVPQPTGIGFCIYIRRACLDSVGFFDEAAFGRGYGEEIDLCRRAARRGWIHVLAADVFIHHVGSVSFDQAERRALLRSASEAMHRRHPDLRAIMRAHVRQDPARPARLALDVARLAASPRPRVLHVLDRDTSEPSTDPTSEPLVLRLGGRRAVLKWARQREAFRCFFSLGPGVTGPEEALVTEVLRAIGVSRIEGPPGHRSLVERLRSELAVATPGTLARPPQLSHATLELIARPERPDDPERFGQRLLELRHGVLDLLDGHLHALARRAPRPLRIAVRRWLERS